MKRNRNEERPLSILFRGCGFMLIYEVGVLKALTELSPEILRSAPKIYGVSSGSFVAAVAVCGCDVGKGSALSFVLYVQRGQIPGNIGFAKVNVLHALRICLRKFLPTNAHQLASGRLHIVLTRVCGWKNVVISEFASKEDIIQVRAASLPHVGRKWVVGGDLMHSSGRSLPRLQVTFLLPKTYYVLQISKANLYRIWCAFVPPTRQVSCFYRFANKLVDLDVQFLKDNYFMEILKVSF
uniref:PNPLA domain-containing protein n=1 Tax=Nothoprocta perdicaria TaxID=30464 RepID=A0A8C6ZBF2_NOTPE